MESFDTSAPPNVSICPDDGSPLEEDGISSLFTPQEESAYIQDIFNRIHTDEECPSVLTPPHVRLSSPVTLQQDNYDLQDSSDTTKQRRKRAANRRKRSRASSRTTSKSGSEEEMEREQKKLRRMERNRESAAASRERKREELKELQAEVRRLREENNTLRDQNARLMTVQSPGGNCDVINDGYRSSFAYSPLDNQNLPMAWQVDVRHASVMFSVAFVFCLGGLLYLTPNFLTRNNLSSSEQNFSPSAQSTGRSMLSVDTHESLKSNDMVPYRPGSDERGDDCCSGCCNPKVVVLNPFVVRYLPRDVVVVSLVGDADDAALYGMPQEGELRVERRNLEEQRCSPEEDHVTVSTDDEYAQMSKGGNSADGVVRVLMTAAALKLMETMRQPDQKLRGVLSQTIG